MQEINTGRNRLQMEKIKAEKNGKKKYQCDKCNYTTLLKHSIEHHLSTHVNDKPLKCRLCVWSAYRLNDFVKHQKYHSDKNADKTETKTQEINIEVIELPKETPKAPKKKEKYRCDKCLYSTLLKSCIEHHLSTHVNDKPLKCRLCVWSAYRLNDFVKHQKYHSVKKFKAPKPSTSALPTKSVVPRKANLIRNQGTVQESVNVVSNSEKVISLTGKDKEKGRDSKKKNYFSCSKCSFTEKVTNQKEIEEHRLSHVDNSFLKSTQDTSSELPSQKSSKKQNGSISKTEVNNKSEKKKKRKIDVLLLSNENEPKKKKNKLNNNNNKAKKNKVAKENENVVVGNENDNNREEGKSEETKNKNNDNEPEFEIMPLKDNDDNTCLQNGGHDYIPFVFVQKNLLLFCSKCQHVLNSKLVEREE